ncbi:MAG: hypothetical protein PHU03_03620 [Syntrophales bacterium]|nr:hypothetical protein [Syntrophales bacterium]
MPQRVNMKSVRIMYFGLVLILFFFVAATAYAHPPSNIAMSYDRSEGSLTVTISHTVGNPEGHYIKEVTIASNGQILETFSYTSQPERSTFTYSYRIDADSGDVLSVKADCSRFGSGSASISVP